MKNLDKWNRRVKPVPPPAEAMLLKRGGHCIGVNTG